MTDSANKHRWKQWFPQPWLSYPAADATQEQEIAFSLPTGWALFLLIKQQFGVLFWFGFFLCMTFSMWQKSFICLDVPTDSVGVNYLRRQSASAPTTSDSAQTFKECLSPGGSRPDVGGCEATYEWAYAYYSATESGLRVHANVHARFIDIFVLC